MVGLSFNFPDRYFGFDPAIGSLETVTISAVVMAEA